MGAMNLGSIELLIILLVVVSIVGSIGLTVWIIWMVTKNVRYPTFGAPLPMGAQQGTDGWQPDPTGRHQLRWVRSGQWTSQVQDGGVTSDDPMP